MRMWIALIVTGLLSSCAPAPSVWPAKIESLHQFSEQEEGLVIEAVETLNTLSDTQPLVSDQGYYPIEIHRVPPNPEHNTRVGFAVRRATGCRIELSEVMFEQKRYELIRAVTLHELGHCGGLLHKDEPTSLMARYTTDFTQYTDVALDEFIHDLLVSIGMIDGNSPGLVPPSAALAFPMKGYWQGD